MYKKPEIKTMSKEYEKPNFLLDAAAAGEKSEKATDTCGCYGSY